MIMPEILESERLVLSRPYPVTMALAEEIFAAVEQSRNELEPWLPWVSATTCARDEFDNYLNGYCMNGWQNQTGFVYIIRTKANNEFVGTIDLMKVCDKNKSGEIGYWLKSKAVGYGYMQEAVLLLESKFFELGYNRIVIGNDTRNIRSVNVAERCGYHLDGIMRQDRWNNYDKCFVDSNVFSKLKTDK